MKVVQMTMTLRVLASEYQSTAELFASMLATAGGMRERMFLLNPDAGVVCGICAFADEIARDDFLAGPVLLQLREALFQRRLEIKLFDLMPDDRFDVEAGLDTSYTT